MKKAFTSISTLLSLVFLLVIIFIKIKDPHY